MTEIRAKDRVFLFAALPLALAALYAFGLRSGLAAHVTALKAEVARLVDAEDFEAERARAGRARAEAAREYAAEKAVPPPKAQVKAVPEESEAAREAALLAVFRAAGLTVLSGQPVSDARPARAADVLRATGARPVPIRRAYRLEGRYGQVLAALDALAAREMAVLVVRLASPAPGHWELEAVL